ncbi:MAG: FliM/FliN family flagellar motor switch protein [Candidatus Latescibacteria bacterium]|jgi:flagellar motor switch/type III secretory pathway protein FliN|nr:FliM/FliN family flagellar motor switch protein [Candidatus Latescibacterota bacterium]MDP7447664.1 FliM/FliN family flagellar motor switch protein [Candidatus Latescibacterota bacterium]HJP29192.1 FliM/FliN family flagellar motor switch protein [Candidatus Latescibacterota bacterium]
MTTRHSVVRGKPTVADLGDIELEAVVELGRETMPLRQARDLQVGDAIRVQRLAGEAMKLTLNGHPFGEGEIVVTQDQLFLRLTRLEPPVEARQTQSTEAAT